jgi:hypothetical protein
MLETLPNPEDADSQTVRRNFLRPGQFFAIFQVIACEKLAFRLGQLAKELSYEDLLLGPVEFVGCAVRAREIAGKPLASGVSTVLL